MSASSIGCRQSLCGVFHNISMLIGLMIFDGDIAAVTGVDCIVNAANSDLVLGGGIAKIIKVWSFH